MRPFLNLLSVTLAWMNIGCSAAVAVAAEEPWTLTRAIGYALTNNPDTRIAEQRIVKAQAALGQAQAMFWPQLQFRSTYYQTDNPIGVFGSALNQRQFSPTMDFNSVPDADSLNVRGLVTVPLYQGGAAVAGRVSAKAGTQVAAHTAAAVRNALAFEVARSFHTVLKTRQYLRAAESAVGAFETNLAIAQKRFNGGTLLKTEVLDVEVRLAQAREDRVRAENAHALALRTLRNLLGIEQGDLAVVDAAPPAVAPQAGDAGGRPELAAARQQRKMADAETRRAKGGYQPRLDAFAGLDYDHGWRFNGSAESWSAGLMLRWDIWDGQLTRSRVREARANVTAAEEQERKVRLAIDLETEQARLMLKEADERLAVTAKAVDQALESAVLTRARFEQGLALASQLVDTETALTAARVRRAEAEADHHIAVAALRKALGLSQLGQ